MRIFGLVLLVAIVAALSATITVYAQGRVTEAVASSTFIPVGFERPNGELTDMGIYVVEVRLSNGVNCYSMTVRRVATALESLNNLEGFSCVK